MIGGQNSVSVASLQKSRGAALRHPVGAARQRYHTLRLTLLVLRFCFSTLRLLRDLLWLKQRQIFAVTFLYQFLHRYELQRGGVHAETLAGRRGAIIEQVAEMRITRFSPNLGTLHSIRSIAFFCHAICLDGLGETGPARATIEFIQGTQERFAGDDIHVNSWLVIIPVGVMKRRLCAALTRHLVLVLA